MGKEEPDINEEKCWEKREDKRRVDRADAPYHVMMEKAND